MRRKSWTSSRRCKIVWDDSRSNNAKPHGNRGASQGHHIAVDAFRCVTATCAGIWLPASGSNCNECHLYTTPLSSNAAASVKSRGRQRRRALGCVARPPAQIAPPLSRPRAPITPSTFSSYAEPETVSSLRLLADPATPRGASGGIRPIADRISGLGPNGPAMASIVPTARDIVPRVDVATALRSRFRHR
jgi:hypothetical protein